MTLATLLLDSFLHLIYSFGRSRNIVRLWSGGLSTLSDILIQFSCQLHAVVLDPHDG